MFRRTIAVILMMPLGLGPAFCCCSIRQLFVPRHNKGCCHHSQARTLEQDTADFTACSLSAPDENRSDCRCKRFHAGLNATQNSGVSLGADTSHLENWLQAVLPRGKSPSSWDIDRLPSPIEMPFTLAGREILRAYHILRC